MKGAIERLYYSITEVSKLVGEEQHVLRYWEREFSQLRPQKNRAGNRIYAEKDLAVLKIIKRLLRDERYTVAGAKEYLRLHGVQEELEHDQLVAEDGNSSLTAATPEYTNGADKTVVLRDLAKEIRDIAGALRQTTK